MNKPKLNNTLALAFKKAVEDKTRNKKKSVATALIHDAPFVGKIPLDKIQSEVYKVSKKYEEAIKNLSDK